MNETAAFSQSPGTMQNFYSNCSFSLLPIGLLTIWTFIFHFSFFILADQRSAYCCPVDCLQHKHPTRRFEGASFTRGPWSTFCDKGLFNFSPFFHSCIPFLIECNQSLLAVPRRLSVIRYSKRHPLVFPM